LISSPLDTIASAPVHSIQSRRSSLTTDNATTAARQSINNAQGLRSRISDEFNLTQAYGYQAQASTRLTHQSFADVWRGVLQRADLVA
jgi:hypothetical protein